jgi:hypothetical protein
MATDNSGNPITPEMIDGMERFNQNDMSLKLKRDITTCINFEIDEAYEKTHPEDAHAYALILPTQFYHLLYVPTIGDVITCTKQHKGETVNKVDLVFKDFRVTKIARDINQSVNQFCLYITVYMMPIETVLPDLATSFLIEDKQ